MYKKIAYYFYRNRNKTFFFGEKIFAEMSKKKVFLCHDDQ